MAYKIVVDSGHGGEDPGAVYPGRTWRSDPPKKDRISEGIPVGISDLLRTVVSGAGRSMSGIQTFGKRG